MGFLSSLGTIANIASPVVGGLESVIGLIGDSAARQEALRRQQEAMQAYGQAADAQYQNLLANGQRSLMAAAGQGGTALNNLGANMGSALAGAGVYNSSAVGGALAQAQANTNQAIADLADRNSYNANTFYDRMKQNLAQMQLGQANTDYGYANQDYHNSQAGFGQFLNALASSNLWNQGSNQAAAKNPDYGPNLASDEDVYGPKAIGGGTGLNYDFSTNTLGGGTSSILSREASRPWDSATGTAAGQQNQAFNLANNASGWLGNGGVVPGGRRWGFNRLPQTYDEYQRQQQNGSLGNLSAEWVSGR